MRGSDLRRVGGLRKRFAVRDGRLITGQQQYAGGVAELVIEALGR